MIQDLHSHTYYSFCGHDSPQKVIEAAIAADIEMLGINDHNYGIGLGTQQMFKANAGVLQSAYHDNMLKRCVKSRNFIQLYTDFIHQITSFEASS